MRMVSARFLPLFKITHKSNVEDSRYVMLFVKAHDIVAKNISWRYYRFCAIYILKVVRSFTFLGSCLLRGYKEVTGKFGFRN